MSRRGTERRPAILSRVRWAPLATGIALLVVVSVQPALAGSGPTRLSDPLVEPRLAASGSPVTVAVTYRNREGSPADWVRVAIGDSLHELAAVGGSREPSDWKAGVRFEATVVAPRPGTYRIVFVSFDSRRFYDRLEAGTLTVVAPGPTPTTTPTPSPTKSGSGTSTSSNSTGGTTDGGGSSGGSSSSGGGSSGGSSSSSGSSGASAPLDPSPAPSSSSSGPSGGSAGSSSGGSAPSPSAGSSSGGSAPLDSGTSGGAGGGSEAPQPGNSMSSGSTGGTSAGSGSGPSSAGAQTPPTTNDPSTANATTGGEPGVGEEGIGAEAGPAAATAKGRLPRTLAGGGGATLGAPGRALLDALGAGHRIPDEVWVASVFVTSAGGAAMAMAFLLFGRRRRQNDEPPDGREPATSPFGMPPTSVLVPDPDVPENERHLPRWRRPSLLEARKTDPLRTERPTVNLTFASGAVRPVEGAERRRIRYRLVRLLDGPDEVRAGEIGILDQGDEVQLLERSGVYWFVLCPDGRRGWLHRMVLGEVVEEALENAASGLASGLASARTTGGSLLEEILDGRGSASRGSVDRTDSS